MSWKWVVLEEMVELVEIIFKYLQESHSGPL